MNTKKSLDSPVNIPIPGEFRPACTGAGCGRGVDGTIDPLAGSYFIESMTDRMEAEAEEYFCHIEELGGVLAAIEGGFLQQEIADAAYRYQKDIDSGERIVVGVNHFNSGESLQIELLKIDPAVEDKQLSRMPGKFQGRHLSPEIKKQPVLWATAGLINND